MRLDRLHWALPKAAHPNLQSAVRSLVTPPAPQTTTRKPALVARTLAGAWSARNRAGLLSAHRSDLVGPSPRLPQSGAPPSLNAFTRSFSSSRPHHDVFFVTVPEFKETLLMITRVTLVALPLAWRWGFFRRFPSGARTLIWLPLASFMVVLGLGLQQSPKTARWRLLLMSEREELEWSNKRFNELIADEEPLLVPPSDPRAALVQAVAERLIQALQDATPVSCAAFPRAAIRDRVEETAKRRGVVPSAQAGAGGMPFMPESSNPEKRLGSRAWSIWVVDLPKINAFVLPSTDIFVYSGLLDVVDGDANLLAAVLAHEIVHVTERHIVEGLGFLALSGVVFDILRGASFLLTLSFPIVGDALAAGFTFLDRQVGQRAFSRKLEVEADTLGLELMARAGYDPRAALELWSILNEVEADVSSHGQHGSITDHIALLRTHPTGEERLAILKEHLPRAVGIYEATRKERAAQRQVGAVLAPPGAEGGRTSGAGGGRGTLAGA